MLLTQVQQRALCPRMDQTFALCFAGRFSEELIAAGGAVHWLGSVRIRQPLSLKRVRRNLGELLRGGRFDVVVVHSSWSHAIFGAVVRAAAVPLVFYMHSPVSGRHWLERWARRTPADAVVCNSHFTAKTASQLFRNVRSEVVYCPVAKPESDHSAPSVKQIRAELQTDHDAIVIIQVSRMEAWKGHAYHLSALSLLKDLPSWICWQVGGAQTPDEKKFVRELKELAARLGIADRVRFLNERRDVSRLLAAADVFCQPNAGPEPFGLTSVEALYAQLPVVIADTGASPEIVDESCGIRVAPADAHSLATALRSLIQNQALRIKLGARGPARARALCDPATQINLFQRVLGSVVSKR